MHFQAPPMIWWRKEMKWSLVVLFSDQKFKSFEKLLLNWKNTNLSPHTCCRLCRNRKKRHHVVIKFCHFLHNHVFLKIYDITWWIWRAQPSFTLWNECCYLLKLQPVIVIQVETTSSYRLLVVWNFEDCITLPFSPEFTNPATCCTIITVRKGYPWCLLSPLCPILQTAVFVIVVIIFSWGGIQFLSLLVSVEQSQSLTNWSYKSYQFWKTRVCLYGTRASILSGFEKVTAGNGRWSRSFSWIS